MDKRLISLYLLSFITLGALIGICFLDPIAQSADYHSFADNRLLIGINNFWNVISNGIFALAGVVGLAAVAKSNISVFPAELHLAYRVFFVGVLLVAAGSSYYHLAPENSTLVWDRLPMTIAFMALFSIILGEYVALDLGRKMLLPLIVCGAAAVGYWWYTERIGQGDLRAYILVQFLPMLLITLILILFRPGVGSVGAYWLLLGCYVLAKSCEHWDKQIYALGLGLSGHTLKHIFAALGVLFLALTYSKRQKSEYEKLN